mmetsp:Transcript_25490/g.63974  ORF Transcript_25490/g.63974 Transcript_25490/m.63974 type:complete len:221 (+) Transcript_25490:3124-3786(+)
MSLSKNWEKPWAFFKLFLSSCSFCCETRSSGAHSPRKPMVFPFCSCCVFTLYSDSSFCALVISSSRGMDPTCPAARLERFVATVDPTVGIMGAAVVLVLALALALPALGDAMTAALHEWCPVSALSSSLSRLEKARKPWLPCGCTRFSSSLLAVENCRKPTALPGVSPARLMEMDSRYSVSATSALMNPLKSLFEPDKCSSSRSLLSARSRSALSLSPLV